MAVEGALAGIGAAVGGGAGPAIGGAAIEGAGLGAAAMPSVEAGLGAAGALPELNAANIGADAVASNLASVPESSALSSVEHLSGMNVDIPSVEGSLPSTDNISITGKAGETAPTITGGAKDGGQLDTTATITEVQTMNSSGSGGAEGTTPVTATDGTGDKPPGTEGGPTASSGSAERPATPADGAATETPSVAETNNVSLLSGEDQARLDELKAKDPNSLSVRERNDLNKLTEKSSKDPKSEYDRISSAVKDGKDVSEEDLAFADRYEAAQKSGETAEAKDPRQESLDKMDKIMTEIENVPDDQVADKIAELQAEKNKLDGLDQRPDAKAQLAKSLREMFAKENGKRRERPIEKEVKEKTAELMRAMAELVAVPKNLEVLRKRKKDAEEKSKKWSKQVEGTKDPKKKLEATAQMSTSLQEVAFFKSRIGEVKAAAVTAEAKYKRITNHLQYQLGMKGMFGAIVGCAEAKIAEMKADVYADYMSSNE